tara:strand:- start:30280 stop:30816 length:537 start_codon:yes stop_codon:yes gene_type:complete
VSATWARQEGESEKAYRAFIRYRDQEKRSQRKVAKALKTTPVWVAKWSKAHDWVERVKAYDEHLAAVGQESAEDAARLAARQRIDASREALALVIDKIRDVRSRGVEAVSLQDVTKLAIWASKEAALVHGEATERTEASVETSGPDVDDLLTELWSTPEGRAIAEATAKSKRNDSEKE